MAKTLFILLAFIGLSANVLNAQTWNIGAPPTPATVTATLSGGTLTISGTGAMENWASSPDVPWYSSLTNINTVVINSSVTTIGDNAFYDCSNLTSVAIPNGVTTIGNDAFRGCIDLTSIAIPNSVTTIGNEAFRNCSGLTSVSIPNSVTTISNAAFSDCTGLTSVSIPNSVTTIGNYAFYGCTGLTTIYANAATPPSIQSNTFQNVPSTVPVIVPCGAAALYGAATYYWSSFFTNFVEPPPSLCETMDNLEAENTSLKADTAALQAIITVLKADSAALEETIASLEDDLSNCGDFNAALQSANTDLQANLVALQQQLDDCLNNSTVVNPLSAPFLQICPNPAGNLLNVELERPSNGTLSLFDFNGKIVHNQSINGASATVNISRFAPGIYLLRLVENGTASAGIKIVKE